jgi:hypothetical protein
MSPAAACKTIRHAISLAASGDLIRVAPATYTEKLTVGISLRIIGSGASVTILDGGGVGTVVTISKAGAHVSLSKLTLQNGSANCGGGVHNVGTLVISYSTIRRNRAGPSSATTSPGGGGGICKGGTLTISDSTISGNQANGNLARITQGGGIFNSGRLTINRSTINANSVQFGDGGGISNECPIASAAPAAATINISTISGNKGDLGGSGIFNSGAAAINNSTIVSNSTVLGPGGIESDFGTFTIQNSIVAKNSLRNCGGNLTSKDHNLSSDGSCSFHGPGDLKDTIPVLGTLGNYGGPTQTMPLLSGSPAIDAANPSGCTDGLGHLLKTDQRGKPRPDPEDTRGCDMGAFERQSD